jgi:catechol 2,3-dioxygenase-like lactoylglutathione lyase family enzyme
MLALAPVHPTLPAADLERARRFYEEVVGFRPTEVLPGGVMYGAGDGTRFLVFPSSGRASGDHTQIGFTVSDLAAEVAELKSRGVTFESYAMPSFDPATSIATIGATCSAWFKDSEGNLVGLVQFVD